MDTFKNALEIVQLIPVFTYLNILSDFLFIENYLSEIDQNKQIPIVNALYKYLDDNQNNFENKNKLIRNLLKGSDLYGEKDNEHFDITFVNVMFEYIISSLIFDKYGNIYGFLADVFCRAKCFQVNQILNMIRKNLEIALFQNEYGDESTLSNLSVNRIYNDIILPLFPRPKANLSLLSHDYIYAQAGLMFLRPGRINTAYYNDFESSDENLTEENLFEEYLLIGRVIEKLILSDEKNFEISKAFALPALSYYILNSKYLFEFENMENIISQSNFWSTAYQELFQYISKAINDPEVNLRNEYIVKMHLALSNFQSSASLLKTFQEQNCTHLAVSQQILRLPIDLHYPESYQCKFVKPVPNLKQYLMSQIYTISELYETYDFQLVQEVFPKSLIDNFNQDGIIIKILDSNNTLKSDDDLSKSEHSSCDILELYFPNNKSFGYFILRRDDYNIIFINKADNPEVFQQEMKICFKKLSSTPNLEILKTTNENMNEFFKNYIKYKKLRLESHLTYLDNYYKRHNKSLKNDWWKEFGLSLVPYYPCLSNMSDTNYYGSICVSNKIKYLHDYQHSLGTTIRSIFLKNAASETLNEILTKNQYQFSIIFVLNINKIFENIPLYLKYPAFQLTYATKDTIRLLEKIINSLKEKTDFSFTSIISSLSKILILKSNVYKSIYAIGEKNSRLVFVNTLQNHSNTGYGYKFIFLSSNISEIAQLRTDYDFNDEKLFLQWYLEKERNIFIALNNVSFQPEPNHIMYEINNQLRRRPIKLLFSGISMINYDEKCNEEEKFINLCQRRRLLNEKSYYENEAINFVKKKLNLSENVIRNILETYTFPDNATLMRFINDGLDNNSFNEPNWGRKYIINNRDLLNELRYNIHFENHNISEFEAEFRINSFYTKIERSKIEEESSINRIITDYNKQNARYSCTFHDYYAIRNYATTGYKRITGDTQEAKFMKIALYKLALRQSDEYEEKLELKLFRFETKPISIIQNISSQQYITLQKFVLAFSNAGTATEFVGYPTVGYSNILYEMIFNGLYVRVKIDQFYRKKERNIILLPGSTFLISGSETVQIGGLGNVLKLKLEFIHYYNEKYYWHKHIMNELAKIN
ncbi:uncharacterized protein LOC127280343 [Leptopilina boulardi]|uniref:uncharacterized protein LOC127280343 n=1 Tax=Leptopilina boulardi TaxID=63433 RepID=UPI0021F53964|nr:uncharacterized protein LOC127280343 [Leptopilina boulardi]